MELTPESASRVEFDEVCRSSASSHVATRSPPSRAIVFADLNYLDLAMRHSVADSLDDLADLVSVQPVEVKVLAFDRRVHELTAGFTGDPAEIRAAGRKLRERVASGSSTFLVVPKPNESTQTANEQTRVQPFSSPRAGRPLRVEDLLDDPLSGRDPNSVGWGMGGADVWRGRARIRELMAGGVDPRPSLAALEAILLAHSGIRGRKSLIVFTTGGFDLPDELWLDYLPQTRLAAQGGFAISAIDARGFRSELEGSGSGLLDYLTRTTGGEALRATNQFSAIFEKAFAHLACYYIFSIPLRAPEVGSETKSIEFRLDASRYPQYRGHRVRALGEVTVLDERAQATRRRLAALMAPDAHRFPEVRLSTTYPTESDGVTTIGVAAVLSDLLFEQRSDEDDAFVASVAIEGVVSDATGRVACRLGDGRRRRRDRTLATGGSPAEPLGLRDPVPTFAGRCVRCAGRCRGHCER
ncbi:MAG: hypothetical protein HC882_00615 [Acidobacteria bacterium]|nr:hypothetical protein [Acidobacteriota bacterium]